MGGDGAHRTALLSLEAIKTIVWCLEFFRIGALLLLDKHRLWGLTLCFLLLACLQDGVLFEKKPLLVIRKCHAFRDKWYFHPLDRAVLLNELNDFVQLVTDVFSEVILIGLQEGLQGLEPIVELHCLLYVLLPLLDLVTVVARQIEDLVVVIIQLDAVLALLFGELISETLAQAQDFLQVNQFNLMLFSRLLGQSQHVNALSLELGVCCFAFELDQQTALNLQLEVPQKLLLVEVPLSIQASKDCW